MSRKHIWLWVALAALYLLHNDWWFWHDSSLVLGMPVGLFYHVVYCLVGSLLMLIWVTHAWPFDRKELKE